MLLSRLIMVSRTNLNPGGSLLKLLPLLLIVQGILGRGGSSVESQGMFDNIKVLKYYILVQSVHCPENTEADIWSLESQVQGILGGDGRWNRIE